MAEYREKFPGARLMTREVRESRGRSSTASAKHLTYGGRVPDARLYSFLVGTLLGDGNLSIKKSARYAEGGRNESYLRWKNELLLEYFPCTFRERLSARHKKTGKRYRGWWIRTGTHPLLTDWFARWYRPKKIVARGLVKKHLDDLALAIWFCDDGYRGSSGSLIYTMAFSVADVAWLMSLLTSRFGITCTLRGAAKGKPQIYIPAKSRPALDRIVAAAKIPGMGYKSAALKASR